MAAFAPIITGILLGFATGDTLLVEDRVFGSFDHASRIAFDIRGRCFVIDRGTSSVAVFSPQFDLTSTLGGFGWDLTAFDGPTGIASDGLSTFIADHGNHRVIRFDQSMAALSTLLTRDSSHAPARFGFPLGVALSRQGELYVLDGENNRVVKFDSRLRFERSFGGMEAGAGTLRQPMDVVVGERGQVMVLESHRIVEFDYAGNYLRSVGEGSLKGARGFGEAGSGVVVAGSSELWFFDDRGELTMNIQYPLLVSDVKEELSDAVVRDERIFVLTARCVRVFRLIEVGR
ncbi:MAG: NHL repeat-containing protein [Bacteroidota bacterium]